jgi:hypothetical protein
MPNNSEENEAQDAFVASMVAKMDTAAAATAAPVVEPTVADMPIEETTTDAPAVLSPVDEPSEETDAPADAPESDEEASDEDEASQSAKDLAAHGAKLTLDDVPDEARPFVQQRIKEIEAGLTRARQRDTVYRAELVELRAETRFQREKPADFVVALIRQSPELANAINAKLDEIEGSPTAAEAHDIVVERHRERARTAETAVADTAAQDATDADALDARLNDRLAQAGVTPSKALELLIANQLDLNEKVSGRRTITAAQVDAIADAHIETVTAATERGRRLERRNASERVTRAKVTDRRAAPPLKPGTGDAPGVGKVVPKNDDEFIAHMVASG